MIKVFSETTILKHHRELLKEFTKSLKGRKLKTQWCTATEYYDECDVAVIFGSWKKLSNKEYKEGRAPHHTLKNNIVKQHKSKPLIVFETPLLGRTITQDHSYYRVGLNHFLNNLADFNNNNSKPDRFNSFGLTIKPWRDRGEHILVLGQNMSDASLLGNSMELWIVTTVKHLLKVTERKIIVRDHPENKNRLEDILNVYFGGNSQVEYDTNEYVIDSLKNAHCSVAFTSGSSIESILEGVPVIPTTQYNFVWSISSHQLNDIENPKLGNREQLLYDLAYTQWSVDEIKQGLPWDHLYENINCNNLEQ